MADNQQEKLWSGDFGDAYIDRNRSQQLLSSNVALFARIFNSARNVSSVVEFGANIGLNLRAIRTLLPNAELFGFDINRQAVEQLSEVCEATCQSALDPVPYSADLALSKGVLIHIHPDNLSKVYENLYRSSKRYICLIEYYNPAPVEVTYRGKSGYLFKRDFAGEMIDQYDLALVDYGFVYHRDPQFPQDDLTWFLLAHRR